MLLETRLTLLDCAEKSRRKTCPKASSASIPTFPSFPLPVGLDGTPAPICPSLTSHSLRHFCKQAVGSWRVLQRLFMAVPRGRSGCDGR